MTSFQRVQYRKGYEKSKFTVEKPDKYFLIQVTKVNTDSDRSC